MREITLGVSYFRFISYYHGDLNRPTYGVPT